MDFFLVTKHFKTIKDDPLGVFCVRYSMTYADKERETLETNTLVSQSIIFSTSTFFFQTNSSSFVRESNLLQNLMEDIYLHFSQRLMKQVNNTYVYIAERLPERPGELDSLKVDWFSDRRYVSCGHSLSVLFYGISKISKGQLGTEMTIL